MKQDSAYQRAAEAFVQREVIYCVSTLVYELTRPENNPDQYQDEWYALWQGPQTGPRYAPDQYRRIVDLDERGEVAVSVYAIDEETGEDSRCVWSVRGPWRSTLNLHCNDCDHDWGAAYAGYEKCPLCASRDLEETGEEGIANLDGSEQFDPRDTDELADYLSQFDVSRMLDTDEDPDEVDDPEYAEVYEHWIVSSYLADLLQEQGETVVKDFMGIDYIWARCTTGQAIMLDGVIHDIIEGFDDSHWGKRQMQADREEAAA